MYRKDREPLLPHREMVADRGSLPATFPAWRSPHRLRPVKMSKANPLDVVFLDKDGQWISHKWAAYIGSKREVIRPPTTSGKKYRGRRNPGGHRKTMRRFQEYGPGKVWSTTSCKVSGKFKGGEVNIRTYNLLVDPHVFRNSHQTPFSRTAVSPANLRRSVCREKTAISSGCETHPANRSLGRKHQGDEGGNKFVEILWCNGSPLGVSDHAGRNVSER